MERSKKNDGYIWNNIDQSSSSLRLWIRWHAFIGKWEGYETVEMKVPQKDSYNNNILLV